MRDAAIDHARQSGRSSSIGRPPGAPSLDGMVDPRPAGQKPAGSTRVGGAMTSAAIAAQRLGGRRGGRASPGLLARLRGRLPRIRPFKAVTVAAFSMALVGIVANAMVFQRGHHPAPLFGLGQSVDGTPDAARQASPAQRADAAPPAQAPAAVERTGTISQPSAPAMVTASAPPVPAATSPKAAPSHHAAVRPRQEDGIGGLLGAKPVVADAHPRPGHAGPKPVKVAEAAPADPHAKPEAKRNSEKPGADHKTAGGPGAPARPQRRLAKADAPSTPDAAPAKKAAKTP